VTQLVELIPFAKEIPGVLVYDLALEGLLSLDDTIDKYLIDLPPWSSNITVLDLLFYASGLPNIDFKLIKNDSLAYDYLKSNKSINPTSKYIYSNWNNFILAKIVENVVNKEFQVYVQENYFNKLEIYNSFYDSTITSITDSMTSAYSSEFGNDQTGHPNFKRFKLCYAPLYMTTGDVLKWIEFVHDKYRREMKYSQHFFRETSLESQGPLGVIQHQNGKVTLHTHGGYSYSYGTATYRNYHNGIAVISMTNKNRGTEVIDFHNKVLDILRSNGLN